MRTSALDRVGLARAQRCRAANLPYGHQRLLEVAMGLALQPKLLILDEPTQGLSEAEIVEFLQAGARDRRRRHDPADRAQHGRGDGTGAPHHGDEQRQHPGRRHAGGDHAPIRRAARLSGDLMLTHRRHQLLLWQRAGAARLLARAAPGEVLCLLGRNGAGKTTALKAIMGLMRPRAGSVLPRRHRSYRPCRPTEVPKQGIGYVPQGRRLFAELTVEENLRVGLMTRNHGAGNLRPRAGAVPGAARTAGASAPARCQRRRAADAGDRARALPRAEGPAAGRADRGSDARR